MPNKPRPDNPARPVRINDKLWADVQELAAQREVTASQIVRDALEDYILRANTTTE